MVALLSAVSIRVCEEHPAKFESLMNTTEEGSLVV